MISAIFPLHIFIFGNHSLLFLSSNSSPLIKEFIDFLILQTDHDLACPSVSFQFHFWKVIFQHKKPIYHIFFPIACRNGNVSRIYIKDYCHFMQHFLSRCSIVSFILCHSWTCTFFSDSNRNSKFFLCHSSKLPDSFNIFACTHILLFSFRSKQLIGNAITYHTALIAIPIAIIKPNTAPIIAHKATIPIVPDKSHLAGMIKNIYGIPTGTPYTSISRNQSISPSTRYRYFPSHPINASTVIINTPLYIKFLNVMHPSPLPYILRSPFVKHHQILKLLQSVFYHTHTPYQSSYL